MRVIRLGARRILYAIGVFMMAGFVVSGALALAPDAAREVPRLSLLLGYAEQFFTFDFEGSPALEVVRLSAELTFYLVGASVVLTTVLGVGIGLAGELTSARTFFSWVTRVIELMSSAPVLIVALVGMLFFTKVFGLMPEFSLVREGSGFDRFVAFVLPVLTLTFGDGLLPDVIRSTEVRVQQVAAREYMRALRAKGVPVGGHYLRSLAPTIAGLIASKVTLLLSSAVVVEYVFNWKGLGYAVVFALQQSKQYELVLLVTMLMVLVVLVVSLAVQIVSDLSDPRSRTTPST